MEGKYDKEDLINLSGQVINGIMSSDSTFWTKLFDRAEHKQIAKLAVEIAIIA
jgi:hypothetical protein